MPEERKLVTILFADVTGSTTLGERLDPEDVRALMGRYYDHARQIIAAHGGTLEKFIGDAVMAVFGLPVAHGDDAERALAAGVALRDAVAHDPILGGRLLLHTGINTGEVVTTSDPTSGDFLVTGDAVNVAARLQQAANPNEMLAGERTAIAAQAAFLFGRERTLRLRGRQERLRAVPVSGPRAARRRVRPPFVGRKQDLAQLALLRDRVLEERQPQLVSILAPAGTGKTRLLEEFLARLDPAAGFQVAIARCPPYGQTLTYWPLRDMLTGLLGGGEITHPRVRDVFAHGGHSDPDAHRLAQLVLGTLGIERDAPPVDSAADRLNDREAIFNAWRLLVETLAYQAPRIVVFENLDWASDSLLDLVEHLMHPRAGVPLLVLALSRPELLDRRPTWGGGHPNFTAIALRPLSDAQTRDLVNQMLERAPVAARTRIVKLAGGNPFFAIELARGLAERVIDDTSVHDHTLPDTVHAAVLARLDLLTPAERAVLQAAAVAGRAFRPSGLQAVLDDIDPATLAAALDDLTARDLILPAEGGLYTFRHILFREVAYGLLSRADRMRLHARLARWLETEAADRLDEYTELIAYHYREAVVLARQSAVPQDLPVDPARAVRFLRRAGELASRAGAFAEARNQLQSAISLAPASEQASLYELLGDSVHQVFSETAHDAYRKALEQWRAEGKDGARDPLIGARLHRKLIIATTRWGSSPREKLNLPAMRDEALRLAEAAGDEDELWRVRIADLFCQYAHSSPAPSHELLERGRAVSKAAAAYFEAREDWPAFSEALDMYSALAMSVGAHAEALEAAQRRLAAPDLPAAERGDILHMIARAYFNLGDYDRCIAIGREALEHVRPGESLVHLTWAVSRAVVAAWFTGRWNELDEFVPMFEEAWEQVQHEPGNTIMWGHFVPYHIALARDDQPTAAAALAVLNRIATPERFPEWHRLFSAYQEDCAELLVDPSPDDWPSATPYPETLMFLSERGCVAPEALLRPAAIEAAAEHVEFSLCTVAIAEALAAGDDARLAVAIDRAEAAHMAPHAARMRVVLAGRTGDLTQLDRARPTLERLGDQQFLHRLEEIATRFSTTAPAGSSTLDDAGAPNDPSDDPSHDANGADDTVAATANPSTKRNGRRARR